MIDVLLLKNEDTAFKMRVPAETVDRLGGHFHLRNRHGKIVAVLAAYRVIFIAPSPPEGVSWTAGNTVTDSFTPQEEDDER